MLIGEITDLTQIKTGDTLLVSTKSFLSEVIDEFQSLEDRHYARFSHAAKFIWLFGELYIIGADKTGVAITLFTEYIKDPKHKLFLCLKPDTFTIDEITFGRFILPLCGKAKYAYWNLFVAFVVFFITFGKVWIGTSKTDIKVFACAHLCAYVDNAMAKKELYPEPQEIATVTLGISKNYKQYKIVLPKAA